MAGLVGNTHCAKSKFQVAHLVKTGGFGQKAVVTNLLGQRGIRVLQQAHGRIDGSEVNLLQPHHALAVIRKGYSLLFDRLENPRQAGAGKQLQHQFNAEISLGYVVVVLPQKSF